MYLYLHLSLIFFSSISPLNILAYIYYLTGHLVVVWLLYSTWLRTEFRYLFNVFTKTWKYVEGKREKERRIMLSLVATTSASAHTTFVRMHFARTNFVLCLHSLKEKDFITIYLFIPFCYIFTRYKLLTIFLYTHIIVIINWPPWPGSSPRRPPPPPSSFSWFCPCSLSGVVKPW